MTEVISMFFLTIFAAYGIYRLFRGLWEHDCPNEVAEYHRHKARKHLTNGGYYDTLYDERN